MRVGIATVQVPFIRGGADVLVEDLASAFRTCGHEVDVLAMPFQFFPPAEVRRSMLQWQEQSCVSFNGYRIDRLVCMKFPSLYAPHPAKVAWMMHQHRSVYDLWDDGRAGQDPEERALKAEISKLDTDSFKACRGVFGISKNVADRIRKFNGIDSGHLLQSGALLGTRTVLNEFISFQQLGALKAAGTLTDPRTTIILTYAMCGFANLVSIGIQIGGIGTLAPSQRTNLAQLGFRAMIAGTLACYLSACVAGMLIG